MGRRVIFRLVALATLLAMFLLALACGVSEPVARVRSTLVPVMQALQTAVVPAPTAASPTASAPGGSESTPAEPPVPAVTGLFELAAGVASELSEGVAANLPSGLSSFDGWREVDLVSPQRAAVIRDLTWVSDGVVGVEIGMVDWLIWTAIDYGEVFDRVIWLDWLSDGVTTQEIRVLKHLYYLAALDVGLALWVAGEPFLETVEYADAPAVESLLKVQLLAPEQSGLVRALLLATGGLTDDWAPIVAMTWPVARLDPAGLVRLYDPSVVRVHTKLVELDQSGMTLLAVVRTEPGAGRTLELVESIVREVEGTMGRPLPLDYVGALFGEAVSPGAIGINYGTGLVIEPRFDVADGGEEAEQLRWVLAHEVAHYWWNGNENWIDEGMSEFMAAASYGYPSGRDYPLLREPCAEARSLSELPPEPRDSVRCDYSLGQRMFFSLYRALGEDRFYQAARRLYDGSRSDVTWKSLDGAPAGVVEVREAFGTAGDQAIDRWYDGAGDYDLEDF